MLFTESAILYEFQTIRIVLLIFCSIVIPLLAVITS